MAYVGVLINIEPTGGCLKDDPAELFKDSNGFIRIFDQKTQQWKMKHVNTIPVTYSYVPRPTNYMMEARLWIQTAHILRHKFIWSQPNIPKKSFEKIASETNVQNFDRYSYLNINEGKRRFMKFMKFKKPC